METITAIELNCYEVNEKTFGYLHISTCDPIEDEYNLQDKIAIYISGGIQDAPMFCLTKKQAESLVDSINLILKVKYS